jgi:hypothetical protein
MCALSSLYFPQEPQEHTHEVGDNEFVPYV